MKKIISLALVLLMLFSILFTTVSCGKDNDTDPPASDGSGNEGGDEGNKDDGKDNGKENTYPGDTPPITLPSI